MTAATSSVIETSAQNSSNFHISPTLSVDRTDESLSQRSIHQAESAAGTSLSSERIAQTTASVFSSSKSNTEKASFTNRKAKITQDGLFLLNAFLPKEQQLKGSSLASAPKCIAESLAQQEKFHLTSPSNLVSSTTSVGLFNRSPVGPSSAGVVVSFLMSHVFDRYPVLSSDYLLSLLLPRPQANLAFHSAIDSLLNSNSH
ncbi:uncharacterized protein MONOS_1449 [Monocercomonoides exilis]|uniref:uncharacterized protein n=1 Tax=Monocercomonoides exilis TaxID=2049356 RepID=UPI00355A7612|nr:hypothetical protein MONOS_1449 [Monocercomonoides exilis]|eukprot:MONOS_1449.1-p1 / transcript=MONOS_1449.1 / gene=MONOS_1449 / organism=Monocercomonoides_exilis_PA203 / gene_product=unspecified product / transcript_product=unspecified product / location=Mono_scaffold00026:2918-3520(+) / protein_length=201 / sequence_SO=supercontig / SO=protein_coding / is_pseudo=false